MKKNLIALALGLMTSNLMAQYITITTETGPGAGGKEVYFGTVADYSQKMTDIAKSVKRNGVNGTLNGLSTSSQYLAKGIFGEGLKSMGSGLGIGLAYGFLNPYVMSYRYDQEYVSIRSSGNGELKAVMFIGDKNPSLSESQIHEILKSK